MKKEKVGITILILFITITTSINIVSLNKSSKLLGTIPSRNIDSNEVDYTENKSVQGAINDLAEKANIIGTDEEKNKFRDDSKTLISEVKNLDEKFKEIGRIYPPESYITEIPSGNRIDFATLTLPKGGIYIVVAQQQWKGGFTDLCYLQIGNSIERGNGNGGGGLNVSEIIDASSAERKVSCRVYQASGSPQTLQSYSCYAIRIK